MSQLGRLLQEISRSVFHLHPLDAMVLFPLAYDFAQGKVQHNSFYQDNKKDEEPASYYLGNNGKRYAYWFANEELPSDLLNVVPITGAITKYGSSFSYGTVDYEQMIRIGEANPKVKAHVLQMDTGGGSVYGTLTLTRTIKEAKKPVIGFIDSYCCSAGMEIISASDEIYASHAMDLMGSIGTLVSWANLRPAYEKMGVEFHEVYATLSTRKNGTFRAVEEKKGQERYKQLVDELLDPINEDFHQTIKTNMPQVLELSESDQEWLLSGPTFFAEKGLSFGLIDGIGSFEAVIDRAFEMGGIKEETNKTTIKVS